MKTARTLRDKDLQDISEIATNPKRAAASGGFLELLSCESDVVRADRWQSLMSWCPPNPKAE